MISINTSQFSSGGYKFTASSGSSSSLDNAANTNASNQQVWLIVGDSKARGTSPTSNDVGPSPYYQNTIYEYISSVNAINSGDVTNASSGSPWMKFGIDYYRATGKKCVFVPRGSGGANFYPDGDNNNWYTSGTLYTPAVNAANNACTAISTTKPRGILMILGANDERAITSALETAANAEIGVNSLFSRLRSDFPDTPIYVWLLGRTENGTGGNVTLIRNYVTAAVAATSNSYIVVDEASYLGMFATDNLHYSGYGNKYFGALAVKNMLASNLISNTPISYSYNSAATTVFARFSGGDALNTSEQNKLNDWIGFLNDAGDWALLDAAQLYMLSTQSKSSIDLIRGTSKSVQITGTVPWTQQGGFSTPGNISNYVSINYVPSTDGVNYLQDSASVVCFLLATNNATGVSANIFGSQGAGTNNQTIIFQSSTGILHRVNSSGSATVTTPSSATNNAFYMLRRTNSSQSIGNVNGVGSTATATSAAVPNRTFTLGVRNNSTPDFPFAGQFGMVLIGGGGVDYTRLYGKTQELMIDFTLNP